MPVSLQSLAAQRDEIVFEAGDGVANIAYNPNLLTKAFRAEVIRLDREMIKSERRMQALVETAVLVVAADGSIEAQAEDEAAEQAIKDMIELDNVLKRRIDNTILSIVVEWDLIAQDGKPLPLTPEDIFNVPATFLLEILMRLVQGSPVGEAQGPSSSTSSASTSKQKASTPKIVRRPTGKRTSRLVKPARR
jgi:hypothetical protein